MRTVKIVADSSANLLHLENFPFACAPLKIITADREFVDDSSLDTAAMVEYFRSYKGKSKTSCPNSSDWLDAFGDADDIFCVTITSGLSGSYNSACIAKQLYESEQSGKRVHVVDSLSAGPEVTLIVEKLQTLISQGLCYEDICTAIDQYAHQTGLLFMLESLKNFAANGRVSPAIAKLTGVLGIRIVGKASDHGTLEPMDKCRGQSKSLDAILSHLKEAGLSTGRVSIAHCANEEAANTLKEKIHLSFPKAQVDIRCCLGLCSYYAEIGGLLVGFEKF